MDYVQNFAYLDVESDFLVAIAVDQIENLVQCLNRSTGVEFLLWVRTRL